ncbi:hypothetical protein L218DRAFT_1077693 [Marasmius fiardii PR-910]|nr:hypothetical protein L218DRAFT_1077693 [Marasmius fiardii PR-910]
MAGDKLLVEDVFRINIRGGRRVKEDTICLARALKIIKDGHQRLNEYYRNLSVTADTTFSFLYPNPVCLPDFKCPSCGQLTFMGKLVAKDIFEDEEIAASTYKRLDVSMALFHAKMLHDGRNVIVKFTPSYNELAHKLLADQGLAPRLLHCEKVAGGWYMVVMEYLDKAQNAYKYLLGQPYQERFLPQTAYSNIKSALEVLHQNNIVFGDVRLQNVMVEEKAGGGLRGYLVDFDGCGTHEEARYPVFLAHILLFQEAGMKPNGIMKKEHDIKLLAELGKLCEQPTE